MRRDLKALPLITYICLLIGISACTSPNAAPGQSLPSDPEVVFQETTPNVEAVQKIDLDNCGGKSELTRTEERTQTIDVTVSAEMALQVGASVQIVSGEVQAAVGAAKTQGGSRSTQIELKAPPNSHMQIFLAWIGEEQTGFAQNVRGSKFSIPFKVFVPNDVRVLSQTDIGCPDLADQNPLPVQTDLPIFAPTLVETIGAADPIETPIQAAVPVQADPLRVNVTVERTKDSDINEYYSIWDQHNITLGDITSPGKRTFRFAVEPEEKVRWVWYWCAKDANILNENLSKIDVKFSIDTQPVPDGTLYEYERRLLSDWDCRYWSTTLSEWKAGLPITLRITYSISQKINDGVLSYPPGVYNITANIEVK